MLGIFYDKFSKIKGGLFVVLMTLCLFGSLVSCHRDPIELRPIATLLLELYRGDDLGEVTSKGAVDDFFAKVTVEYETDTFEFNCFFTDAYNKGYYSIDPAQGDNLFGFYDSPFRIVVETEIEGVPVRGESDIIRIMDQEVATIGIELKAGYLRIGTRAPREEDIFGNYAFVGGEVYELGLEQNLREGGIICIS